MLGGEAHLLRIHASVRFSARIGDKPWFYNRFLHWRTRAGPSFGKREVAIAEATVIASPVLLTTVRDELARQSPARFVQFRIEEMMMRGMGVAKDSRKNKTRAPWRLFSAVENGRGPDCAIEPAARYLSSLRS
jgi:hypothetical protein